MPRLAGGRSVTSRPASRTVPDVGRTNPASALSAVDLPDPLGPSSATVSPGATRRLKSISAFVAFATPAVGHADAIEGDCRRSGFRSLGLLCRGRGRPTPTRLMPRLRRSACRIARSVPSLRSSLAAIRRSRAITSATGRLLVRGDVGVQFGEHGVPVRHPHVDARRAPPPVCSVRPNPLRWCGSGRGPGCPARRAHRLLDVVGQQELQQLLGRRLRAALPW